MITFDRIINILEPMNPWWNDSEWHRKDQEIINFNNSKVQWQPRLMFLIHRRLIEKEKTGIITVRGPRRLGKTTMIKRLIQIMVAQDVNPRRIVYIQCDDPQIDKLYEETGNALKRIIIEYTNNFKSDLPIFFFFDEATFYKGNWAREIKSAADQAYINKKAFIYITGSSALDLDTSRNLLIGRQGDVLTALPSGSDQFLYPMRFVEFVETVNPDIFGFLKENYLMSSKRKFSLFRSLTKIKDNRFTLLLETINEEFGDILATLIWKYILGGGYARNLHSILENNFIPLEFYEEVYTTIIQDAYKLDLEREVIEKTLEIILTQHENSSTIEYPKFLQKIAQDCGISKPKGSIHPIEKYVRYLTNLKFALIYYKVNIGSNVPSVKKSTTVKTYLRDPFMFQAIYSKLNSIPNPFKYFNSLLQHDKREISAMIEGIVASHMAILPFLLNPVPNYDEKRFSGIYKAKKEIDFVSWTRSIKDNTPLIIPVEVKYRNKIRGDDLENALEFSKKLTRRVLIATKKDFKIDDNVILLPVPILLLLI
ncbi:hypothetical protein PAP_04870 [Palaeococcus pacificus DY20341]|uniref:AAA domain-containing protein n=2 Tax=Palaeococcus TaxID=83867 RepID=A0A075LRL1_9EURY|nr:hypothetical protein PAP_04870 [Palaeococcus pacificus DY20341]